MTYYVNCYYILYSIMPIGCLMYQGAVFGGFGLLEMICGPKMLMLRTNREIHPLEPQRHRHSMLVPRVCAPRVTWCSLGHVIWSVQLACSILSRSDSCQGDGRQRHLRMQAQYPLPVYYSQGQTKSNIPYIMKKRKTSFTFFLRFKLL